MGEERPQRGWPQIPGVRWQWRRGKEEEMMYIYSLIFISLLIHYNLTFTKSYLGFYIFFLSCPNFLERHIYCWALKFIRKYFSISFRSLFNMSFVKILRSEKKLRLLSVFTSHGVINGLFSNSNLYDQAQYKAVNAKTWADKAFVINS